VVIEMAQAIFLNITGYVIYVNLNSAPENQQIQVKTIADDLVVLRGWPAPISTNPNESVFGGGDFPNYLTVFSSGHIHPRVWEICSNVSTILNLFFYILDAQIVGIDQTGSSAGIQVTPASDAVAARILQAVRPPIF
jgi:hypothetical protein